MSEWKKTFQAKLTSGFFLKYMYGKGLDIGYKGYTDSTPILNAIGIDLGYPGYDGIHLPFIDNSQDYVYNSHTLEHIEDWSYALQEWFRVTKPGGHIIIVVPNKYLYEKKNELPSRFNADHKRFYTPASLLTQIEMALQENSFRVRHLQDNDEGHDYDQIPEEHSRGCYETEVVIQKL